MPRPNLILFPLAHIQPQTEIFLERIQKQFDIMLRMKFTYDAVLLDTRFLISTFNYYQFVCDYFLHLADPQRKGLPLPAEAPVTLRALPEFLVEDLADYFIFLARFSPETFRSINLTSVADFISLFLAQTAYIKSPHLRSKLAEILYMFTPDYQDQSGVKTNAEYVFSVDQLVYNSLARGLMDFYQGETMLSVIVLTNSNSFSSPLRRGGEHRVLTPVL